MSLSRWGEYEKLSINSNFLVKGSINKHPLLIPSCNRIQHVDCANILYGLTPYSAFSKAAFGRTVLLYAPTPTMISSIPRRIHYLGGRSRELVLFTTGNTVGITTWEEYKEL